MEPPAHLLKVPAAAWVDRAPQSEMDDRTRLEAIQAYYATITFMDAQLGRVLDALDRLSLWDDTIVVFTSDHGYHLGEHQLWQKTTLFENSARVPLVIASPDHKSTHGRRTGAVSELIDLYPTLTDLTGLQAPSRLAGASLKPQLENVHAPGRAAALTTFITNDRVNPREPRRPAEKSYSIRTERYRFTPWGERGRQGIELYDHLADPRELNNASDDPEYADVARRLEDLLATQVGSARTPAARK